MIFDGYPSEAEFEKLRRLMRKDKSISYKNSPTLFMLPVFFILGLTLQILIGFVLLGRPRRIFLIYWYIISQRDYTTIYKKYVRYNYFLSKSEKKKIVNKLKQNTFFRSYPDLFFD